MIKAMERVGLQFAEVHGCAVGYTSADGRPMHKPLRIATDGPYLCTTLSAYKCPGHLSHAEVRGKDATASERYTEQFAQLIHAGWADSAAARRAPEGAWPPLGPHAPRCLAGRHPTRAALGLEEAIASRPASHTLCVWWRAPWGRLK